MRLFKRLQATVVTGFDSLISSVENHEAIVEAAISETRSAATKARGRLAQVTRDARAMKKRIEELETEEEAWHRRAIAVPEADEAKALECVRRKRRVQREREYLQSELVKQSALERQLAADLRRVEERISDLRRKKNAYSAREYRTRAVEAGDLETKGIIDDLDGIFDRWEAKLAEREPYVSSDYDQFEEEFVRDEEESELKNELENLRAQKKTENGREKAQKSTKKE